MPHKSKEARKAWMQEKMKDPDYAAHVRERQRKYRLDHGDTIRKQEQESYRRHSQEKCERCKVWRLENPDKVREYGLRARNKNKLNANMRTSVYASLKGTKNRQRWTKIVGYTAYELRDYLESLFTPGMSWDNYGEWHVDHVRPVSSFTITDMECDDFKACWALSNLQPLWATTRTIDGVVYEGNINKSNKWKDANNVVQTIP